MDCDYCHRPIQFAWVQFKDKNYHALENERGESVDRPDTCWDHSEQGKKSL